MDSPIHPLSPPRPFFLAGAPRARRSAPSDDREPRSPPSSFAFPFQAYPGNPDPLPNTRRRNSLEDIASLYPAYARAFSSDTGFPRSGSLSDLQRPNPPFMADSSSGSTTPTSTTSVYRNSAAANMLPRSHSQTFRAPFLSPASRPPSATSWSPPPPTPSGLDPSSSSTALPLHASLSKTNIRPSTLLIRNSAPNLRAAAKNKSEEHLDEKEPPNEKSSPVENHGPFPPPPRARLAWSLTVLCMLAGLAGAALLCWFGIQSVKSQMLNENSLCLVMDENWASGQLDDSKWAKDVELGG